MQALGTCQTKQEVIDRACVQKVLNEAEVIDGEARFAKVVAEAATLCPGTPCVSHRSQSFRQGSMPWCWTATHYVLPLRCQSTDKERGWVAVLSVSKTSHPFPLPMSRILQGG